MHKKGRDKLGFIMLLGVLFWLALAVPASAHWADLAVAEIAVGETQARMTLTFPTGLVAPESKDRQLSPEEVGARRAELVAFLGDRIRLMDGARAGTLTVESTAIIPSNVKVAPGTHSTLLLTYTWTRPVRRLAIHYDLFLPGISTASCLATVLGVGRMRTFVFTPEHREFSFSWASDPIFLGVWRIPLILTALAVAALVGVRLSGVSEGAGEVKP